MNRLAEGDGDGYTDGRMDEWMDRQFGHPNTILSIKDAHYAGTDL